MIIFDAMQEIKAYVTTLSKPTIIGKKFFFYFTIFFFFFFLPHVKQRVVVTNKNGMYELPHELPNDLHLRILEH